MQRNDFTITYENGRTVVAGARKKDHDVENIGVHRKTGTFNLEFIIPPEFNSQPIKTALENGVLTITYPPYSTSAGFA